MQRDVPPKLFCVNFVWFWFPELTTKRMFLGKKLSFLETLHQNYVNKVENFWKTETFRNLDFLSLVLRNLKKISFHSDRKRENLVNIGSILSKILILVEKTLYRKRFQKWIMLLKTYKTVWKKVQTRSVPAGRIYTFIYYETLTSLLLLWLFT